MDMNRLTQKSQEALHDAQTKALRFGHVEVDGEHLLLALLDQGEGLVAPLLARDGRRLDRVHRCDRQPHAFSSSCCPLCRQYKDAFHYRWQCPPNRRSLPRAL